MNRAVKAVKTPTDKDSVSPIQDPSSFTYSRGYLLRLEYFKKRV